MKIAIYGQQYRESDQPYVKTLQETLQQLGCEYAMHSVFHAGLAAHNATLAGAFPSFTHLPDGTDVLVTLGGDGTILRSLVLAYGKPVPVAGINLGRLGFLATIQRDEIAAAITQIVQGKYSVSHRSLLSATPQGVPALEHDFALNEIAVSRKDTASMIQVDTYLDDEFLTTYWADGLIIATPTGSTGYSLSCGGPVLTPDTQAVVLTPIAPHNLNARPLVIPSSTRIKLVVHTREKEFLMSMDNRVERLAADSTIIIQQATETMPMVVLEDDSFLGTLSQKLLWGQDKRN